MEGDCATQVGLVRALLELGDVPLVAAERRAGDLEAHVATLAAQVRDGLERDVDALVRREPTDDRDDCRVLRASDARAMSIAFNMVTGVAIALMIPAAGALLVSTIMVLPASIALRIGKSFRTVILIGMAIGFVGMLAGLIVSYYGETPASASITLLFIGIFLLVNAIYKLKK